MIIREILEDNKWRSEAPAIKKYSCLNVGFVNHDGQEDETQLDVEHSILTQKGIKELDELFGSLCEELNTDRDSVQYIDVAASADTKEKLIAIGY